MNGFFFCGPLSAEDAEGRILFEKMDLELREKDLTLLDGPSGSGKSTVLRKIAGLESAPDVRRVLGGEEYELPRMAQWRSRVTLMSQDAPILEGDVEKNLVFPYTFDVARERSFDRPRAVELMGRVGLAEIPLTRDASTLSGGERHRLGLVRALLWDPPVLLADEPLSGLDAARAEDCFHLLADFAHRPGHAVLCVLHDAALGTTADEIIRIR